MLHDVDEKTRSLSQRIDSGIFSIVRRAPAIAIHVGVVAAVLGLGKIHAQQVGGYDYTESARFAWSLAYIFLLSLAAYGVGLPGLTIGWGTFRAACLATAVAVLAVSLVQLVVGSALLPRFVVLLTPVVLIPWYAGCAALARRRLAGKNGGERVIAVVSEGEGHLLREDLSGDVLRPATLVGTLGVDEAAEAGPSGVGSLRRAATAGRVSVLVLNRAALEDQAVVSQAADLHAAGLRVRTLTLFYDEWLGKLPLGEMGQTSLMFDIGELHSIRYTRMKRIVDALIGVMGSVAVIAVLPVVILGKVLGNRGPLLHRQTRIGKGGVAFEIYKFRTMRPGPSFGKWTEKDDLRVTTFGRWMRRIHLDELPQMFNILRGDLATVGPRPEQPYYVEQLAGKIPFYDFRHLVRPGLTGWAQVNYTYGSSEVDALEKLRYELYYLRHQSLSLDLRILLRTVRSVMMAGGR